MNSSSFLLDTDYPGGNILVDAIHDDGISLHQDLRDTTEWWFYWNFRVRGAPGRSLTFHFTQGDVIGTNGPAVSFDEGESWEWLGEQGVDRQNTAFTYTFPAQADSVRFCFTIPYLQADLQRFLARFQGQPNLELRPLCLSQQGRPVELLRLGRLAGNPPYQILLTCRHHACESIASFALEGILETVLGNSAEGGWLRQNVELWAAPFMDKDGVENGDQGKSRYPHDHNRDYAGESLYPTVRAIKHLGNHLATDGRLSIFLDLHCPWIRGEYNEWIYFVGDANPLNWQRACELSQILESSQTGPLRFSAANNLPHGKAWNTGAGMPRTASAWARTLPGIGLASSIEIPYARMDSGIATAETARAFGRDLARAIWIYLESR